MNHVLRTGDQAVERARRRMADNALRAAIRRGVSDEEWSELMRRYDDDALRRLLNQENPR